MSEKKCSIWRAVKWISVEPLMLLGMYASFLCFPTTVQLVYARVCSSLPNCTTSEQHLNSSAGELAVDSLEQAVQTESSHILLYANLALGLPSGALSLVFGHVSDGQGRKPFMLLCLLASLLSRLLLLSVVQLNASVYLVVLANFLDGCGGGYPVLNLLLYAHVADVSTPAQRTRRISVLEACFYLAAGLASLTSGVVIAALGFSASYLIGMAVLLVAGVYAAVAVRESVPSTRAAAAAGGGGGAGALAEAGAGLRRLLHAVRAVLHRRPRTAALCTALLAAFFSTQVIFLGLNDIDYLFALGQPLHWGPRMLGFFSGYLLLANGLVNVAVLPAVSHVASRRSHAVPDYGVVCVGLVSGIALLVGIGVSTQTWHMFLAATLGSLRGLYTSTLRSILSKIASKKHEGVMFAVLSILQTLASILASVFYNSVYPPTRKVWPGLAFVIMGITLIPALLMMLFIWVCNCCRIPKPEESSIMGAVQ